MLSLTELLVAWGFPLVILSIVGLLSFLMEQGKALVLTHTVFLLYTRTTMAVALMMLAWMEAQ